MVSPIEDHFQASGIAEGRAIGRLGIAGRFGVGDQAIKAEMTAIDQALGQREIIRLPFRGNAQRASRMKAGGKSKRIGRS